MSAVWLLSIHIGPLPAAPPAAPFTGAIQNMKRSVVPLACISVSGTVAETLSVEGTGFFVSADGTFVTANHVIDGMVNPGRRGPCPHTAFFLPQSGVWSSQEAHFQSDYYVFHVAECKRDPDIDVARCRSVRNIEGAHKIIPVSFDTALQPDGTAVAFTGFPLQFQVPLSSVGTVSGYVKPHADGRGPRAIIMDKSAWPGASGSPMYLGNGKVVALVGQRGVNDGSGRAIGVPSRLIKEFLTQNAGQ